MSANDVLHIGDRHRIVSDDNGILIEYESQRPRGAWKRIFSLDRNETNNLCDMWLQTPDGITAELAALRAAAAERDELKRTVEALEQDLSANDFNLKQRIEAQAAQLEQAWSAINDAVNHHGGGTKMLRAWLAANAPAPEAEETK